MYDTSTLFNVAVQYLQCKHLETFARSQVCIIHENSYFRHQQQSYYTRYFTILSAVVRTFSLTLYFIL